ncbi:MAG: gamma-glutamyl-gamma-aminobutyrate hydrolase family protein [Chlamydiales bacterium]|nr:gamma-glutamyl-gamma-aminobutyrate hydrolase family protein [Chlamydiales bacterium]
MANILNFNLWKIDYKSDELCKYARITAGFISLNSTGSKVVVISNNYLSAIDHFSNGRKLKAADCFISGTLIAISTPASQVYSMAKQTVVIAYYVLLGKWSDAGSHFIECAVSLSFLKLDQTHPEEAKVLKITSALAQKIYTSFRRDRLEFGCNLLQSAIKLYLSKDDFSKLKLKHFGKTLKQDDLDLIQKRVDLAFTQSQQGQAIQFGKKGRNPELERAEADDVGHMFDIGGYLFANGYSNYLKGMIIENGNGLHFRNLYMKECKFNYSQNIRITDSILDQCRFRDVVHVKAVRSIFSKCAFKGIAVVCSFSNVSFVASELKNVAFLRVKFEDVIFANCNIKWAVFNGSEFVRSIFYKSQLFESSFFLAKITASKIVMSNAIDSVFANADFLFQRSTRLNQKPVIAYPTDLSGFADWGNDPKKALRDTGAVLMPFAYHPNANDKMLKNELEKLQPKVQDSLNGRSIIVTLNELAKEGTKELAHIKKLIDQAVMYSDGIFLHGGANVSKCLYSQSPQNFNPENFRHISKRDLIDGLLAAEAAKQGVKAMGVCRGCQMLWAVHGGEIKTVDGAIHGGQYGDQKIEVSKEAQDLLPFLNGTEVINGYSCHGQMCDPSTKSALEIVLSYNGVPKAIVGKNVIATQFHPEEYYQTDPVNRGFYTSFVEQAKGRLTQ